MEETELKLIGSFRLFDSLVNFEEVEKWKTDQDKSRDEDEHSQVA